MRGGGREGGREGEGCAGKREVKEREREEGCGGKGEVRGGDEREKG